MKLRRENEIAVIDSQIERTAIEYNALQVVLLGLHQDDQEPPEFLHDRGVLLVQRLTVLRASCGNDLARKATVLLDWIHDSNDVTSDLTLSLCRDTVHLFPLDQAPD